MTNRKSFRITYTDPETGDEVTATQSFEDTETISAEGWAEDWAYTAADKGWFEIEEIKDDRKR